MNPTGTEADARIVIDDLLRQAGWIPGDQSMVRTEVPAAHPPGQGVLVDRSLARPFDTHAPVYDLEAAAGAFGSDRAVGAAGDEIGWAAVPGHVRLTREHFVARINGHSMEPTIPDGSYSLFRVDRGGSRAGKLVLVWHGRCTDPALGGEFSVGWAERVLVLVDREQLATQALEAIQDVLAAHSSYWLRSGMARQEQQITVTLLQTMIGRVEDYTAGYFDVVIADECHRSIYGSWRGALIRFDALHIGLTATPAGYIERNTYVFYQCETGKPDFSYSIQDAFRAGYLVPYRFATGVTELVAEGADLDDEHYDPAAFEKQWTNEASNRLMMDEFDRLAWENHGELAPGQDPEPGKAIVFAITKHHAARLAQYLNERHPEQKGRYAAVITSDVADPDVLIREFKTETYPMVAVSVGMLDTGFDFREVLHLVLCRRVRSPILYQQMRGRGTRTAPHIGKRTFVVYDFFRNHQYFNDSDTDVFTGGASGRAPAGPTDPPALPGRLVELGLEDEWLEAVTYVEVGPEGERVDKEQYVSDWQQAIRSRVQDDPLLRKVRDDDPLDAHEEQSLARRLNVPERYFNEENLRRAYRNPGGTLVDFIPAALGRLHIKSREEQLDEAFRAWLVSRSLTTRQAEYLCLLKNRGIATGRLRVEDLFEPPLAILDVAGRGIELFGEEGLKQVVQDLSDDVFRSAS